MPIPARMPLFALFVCLLVPTSFLGLVATVARAEDLGRGLILFDASHGVWSDPYHGRFTISDGYSNLAKALRDEGFRVEEITKPPISSQVLSAAKALVIVSLIREVSTGETSAIEDFIARGGGLLVLGDSSSVLDSDGFARLNALTGRFDIRLNRVTIWDLDDSVPESAYIQIHEFADHEITIATGSINYVWGSSLTVGPKASAIAFADEDSWADKNFNRQLDRGEKTGPLPAVAVSEFGQGRVVCFGERRFLTSLHIADPKAPRMSASGRSFDTLSFALKTFYWLTRNPRDVSVVSQGKIVALVPTPVYQKERARLDLAFRMLNAADPYLSLLYNKTFSSIAFEVFPIFSRPDDPQMWGATISRNKIIWAAWYLDQKNVNDEDFVWSVLHEYTHSFDSYHYSYMLPSWLEEGLASAVPLMLLPQLGLRSYADAEWEALDRGADTYISKRYTSALVWNHSSFDERWAAYGFACSIVKHIIDEHGWGTFAAFFRLLEIQQYPLGEPTNFETYEVDPVTHTNRAIERLCVVTNDTALLELFVDLRFPVSQQTQQSILHSMGEMSALKVTKSASSEQVDVDEEIRIQLEVVNLSDEELSFVEIIDFPPLAFIVKNGKNNWSGTLKRGQNVSLTYVIETEQGGDFLLSSAMVVYRAGRGDFSVARSNSLKLTVSDPMLEQASTLLRRADDAIRRALQEGRTQGLDLAIQKFSLATEANSTWRLNEAVILAREALELAEKATAPATATARTATLPTQAYWLRANWIYLAGLIVFLVIAVPLVARKIRRAE